MSGECEVGGMGINFQAGEQKSLPIMSPDTRSGATGINGRQISDELGTTLAQIRNKHLAEAERKIAIESQEAIKRFLSKSGLATNLNAMQGPQYALQYRGGVWKIIFDYQAAEWKNEKGMHLINYMLKNQIGEMIYGTDLADKVAGRSKIQELSLGKDDAERRQALQKKARTLYETMADPTTPENERTIAREQFEDLADSQSLIGRRPETNAEKIVRAVRKAILRLHEHLEIESGKKGGPNHVYGRLAEHLKQCIIIPSQRYGSHQGARNLAGVAGCFIYEAPTGIQWAD